LLLHRIPDSAIIPDLLDTVAISPNLFPFLSLLSRLRLLVLIICDLRYNYFRFWRYLMIAIWRFGDNSRFARFCSRALHLATSDDLILTTDRKATSKSRFTDRRSLFFIILSDFDLPF
jgi:hypothetical protein